MSQPLPDHQPMALPKVCCRVSCQRWCSSFLEQLYFNN